MKGLLCGGEGREGKEGKEKKERKEREGGKGRKGKEGKEGKRRAIPRTKIMATALDRRMDKQKNAQPNALHRRATKNEPNSCH